MTALFTLVPKLRLLQTPAAWAAALGGHRGAQGPPACPDGSIPTSTGWAPDLSQGDQGGIFKPELHLEALQRSPRGPISDWAGGGTLRLC